MESLFSDLRAGVRYWCRCRGLAFVALTSLAVSIGFTVAITTVSAAVLMRPLPYDRPERLVMVWRAFTRPSPLVGFWGRRQLSRQLSTPALVQHWREQALPFEDLAVYESWETGWTPRVDLVDHGSVQRLRGTLATPNLFRVLGVQAAIGRTFGDDESDVAVISDRLWRRSFGADPAILGTALTIAAGRDREQRRVVIVGVLPARVRFDYPEETEIWLPLPWSAVAREFQVALAYRAVARLRPDTSIAAAEAAMQRIHDAEDLKRGNRIWLEPIHEFAVGASRGVLVLVSALAALVLFSGAVNAATAFAASTVSRLRELRVRRALGASRARLVRQLVAEAAALGIVAGAVGALTVALAMPALRGLLPAGLPRADEVGVDGAMVVSAILAVLVSTALTGFVPAWLSVSDRSGVGLEDTPNVTVPRAALRLRCGLLGFQFALVTLVLIVGAGLIRSLWNIVHVDKGFDVPPHVLVARFELMHPAYRDTNLLGREQELLRLVRAIPSVEAATLTSSIPLRGTDFVARIRGANGQLIYANRRHVDPGYFDVLRVPLISGRWLTEADANPREWVALVSQSLADALYPGESPLGRFLEGSSGTRIVGVVADIRTKSLLEPPTPAYYWPRALQPSNPFWLIVRTAPGAQISAELRRAVRSAYPDVPLPPVIALAQVIDDSIADRRASAVVSGACATVLLLLAGLGLCGHLAHVVAERTRDLAIRSALGASAVRQILVVVGHVVFAMAGGVGVAIAAAYLVFPFLEPFIFGIDRVDTLGWIVSALLVVTFTTVAMAGPASRLRRLEVASVLKAT